MKSYFAPKFSLKSHKWCTIVQFNSFALWHSVKTQVKTASDTEPGSMTFPSVLMSFCILWGSSVRSVLGFPTVALQHFCKTWQFKIVQKFNKESENIQTLIPLMLNSKTVIFWKILVRISFKKSNNKYQTFYFHLFT